MKYINKAGLVFEILSEQGRKCIVRFLDSGSMRSVLTANAKAGKVKDLYSPSRYGIGYDGEFEKVYYWKQARQLWSNMLKRCYCKSDNKGYYGKCFVDARWLCFANFLNDLPELKNFKAWIAGNFMELDKDSIIPGNTVYSKHACCFLDHVRNRQTRRAQA